ncbi:MAG: tape measure protein [Eubacteriales bacterium]|nr:tape measure protein [Eubacteriales bacterium]
MATVRNTISLVDRFSPVLQAVNKSLRSTMAALSYVDGVSDSAFNNMRKDIDKADQVLEEFRRGFDEVAPAADKATQAVSGMSNPLMSIASGFYTLQSIIGTLSQATAFVDEITLTTARIGLMNDGLQTTAELQGMIFDSANASRTAYTDTASVVAKLGILAGENFSSSKEIVSFAETMNKAFVVGGAGMQERTSAMYQLTQAMAAGKLQGDEFRSIMENAPLLAAAIATYTGKSKGDLKEMSSQGVITADIIKGALFASADEINKKFEQMPITFGQATQMIMNDLIQSGKPVIDWLAQGGQWISDNWSHISSIFMGVSAGLAIYATATLGATAATWVLNGGLIALSTTLFANPFIVAAMVIGLLVWKTWEWIQAVGGIKIAWMIASNGVMDIVDGMKASVLSDIQDIVNGSINLVNQLIALLNKIPGVTIEAMKQVNFGDQAETAAALNHITRNVQLADAKATLEAEKAAKAEGNSTNISGGKLDSVGKIDSDVTISDEDIKMMRDIAAVEFVNRYTTLRPEMTLNFGDVRETADVNAIIGAIETMAEEALNSSLSPGGGSSGS